MTPLRSCEGLLSAMATLGIDVAKVRAASGLSGDLGPDDLVPPEQLGRAFEEAARQRPRPELPSELGLATPIGCFGIVDYLAGSSATVRSALVSLAAHFTDIARDTRLSLSEEPAGLRLEVRAQEGPMREEITLAVTIGRFRRLVVGGFRARSISLRSAPPGEARYAELYGCPVELGAQTTSMSLDREVAERPLASADPQLAATLAATAARLGLGAGDLPEVELAVRSRLRDLLEQGRGDASSVARAIGVSERTLHRRLSAAGRTFQGVLDAFREHESIRLLRERRAHAEIAITLGYADQSAWSRAFKRWTGKSPSQYAAGPAPVRTERDP